MRVFQQASSAPTLSQGASSITSGMSSATTSVASVMSLASSPSVAAPTVSPNLAMNSTMATAVSSITLGPTVMLPVSEPQVSFNDIFEIDEDRGLALMVDLLPGSYVDDQDLGVLSTEGDFTYQLRFFIDKTAAISNSVTKVVFKYFEEPSGNATAAETQGLTNTSLASTLSSVSMMKGRTAAYSAAVSAISSSPASITTGASIPSTALAIPQTQPTLTSQQLSLISSTAATGYFKEKSVDLCAYLGLDEIPTTTELSTGILPAAPTTYTVGMSPSNPSSLSAPRSQPAHVSLTTQINLNPTGPSVNPFNNTTMQAGGGLPSSTTSVPNRVSSNSAMTAVQNESIDPASLGQLTFVGATLGAALGTNSPGLGLMGASPYAMGNISSPGINSVATMHSMPNPVGFGSMMPVSNLKSNNGTASIGNVNSSTVLNSTSMSSFSQNLFSCATTNPTSPPVATAALAMPTIIASVSSGVIESELIEIVDNISFGIEFLAQREKFYVVVELMGDNGTSPIASKEYTITHREMLQEFLYPDIPPSVSCTLSLGEINNLMILQRDPIATHVRIERKIVDPDNLDNGFGVIEDKLQVSPSMGGVIYTDSDANCYIPKSAIYRVTPIGPLGGEGTTFGWTVVNGVPAPVPVPEGTSKYSVNLNAINVGDGLKIEITNIPETIESVSLLKKCYSLRGFPSHQEYIRVPVRGRDIYTLPDGRLSVSVTDKRVTSNFEYLYQCEVHPRAFASSEIANGYVLKEYIAPIQPDIGGATIDGFTFDTAIGGVKYNLTAKTTEQSFQKIQDLLKAAGVADSFISDLKENRSRLDDMASFLVSRINLKSGKTHSFGVYPSGEFKDSTSVRGQLGIPSIQAGVRYRYVNELILTPPESLLKDAMTKIETQDKVNPTEEVLAEKFFGSMFGDRRTPSQRELNDRSASAEKQLLRGRTGIEISQEYVSPALPPEISQIRSERNCLGINTVTFTCTGDISQVDHFLVCCSFMGTTSVLGSVSVGQSPGASYTFRDLQLSREIGEIEYFVVIVKNNYTKVFNPSTTTTLIRETDAPSILLDPKHAPKTNLPSNLMGIEGTKAGSSRAARQAFGGGKPPGSGITTSRTGKFMLVRDNSGVSQTSRTSFKGKKKAGSSKVGSSSSKKRSGSKSGSKPKKATATQLKSLPAAISSIASAGKTTSSRSKSKTSSRKSSRTKSSSTKTSRRRTTRSTSRSSKRKKR